MWYFRDETIAVPKPVLPLAGFACDLTMVQDLAAWVEANQSGSAPAYPPLVWIGSPLVERGAALDPNGERVETAHGPLALQLVAKLPLNGSWFDASSVAFFCGRPVKMRGNRLGDTFVARTFWPQDFRLPEAPEHATLAAGPAAIRDWVRAQPQGGALMALATTQAAPPVAMECRFRQCLEFGEAKSRLIVGEVVMFHVRDGLVNNGKVETRELDPIARIAGPRYASLGEIVTLNTVFQTPKTND